MIKLSLWQNDPLIGESFWQNNSLVTHILFELCLIWYINPVANFGTHPLEHPFLLCPVLSRVPSRFLAIPAHPVPNFGCPSLSHPLARFLACPVVPLSRKVALSRSVGKPSSNHLMISLRVKQVSMTCF